METIGRPEARERPFFHISGGSGKCGLKWTAPQPAEKEAAAGAECKAECSRAPSAPPSSS